MGRPRFADYLFLPENDFEGIPHPRARLVGSLQVLGFVDNALQARHQPRATGAILHMRLQLRVAAVFDKIRQSALELCTVHDFSLPKTFSTACTACAFVLTAIRPFRLCSF